MTERHNRGASRTRALRAAGTLAFVAVAAATALSSAGAQGAASGGAFDEYQAGPGLGYTDVSGRTELIRTGDGRTVVSVELSGLRPETTYAVHVHDSACGDLGGHSMFPGPVPGGAGPGGNEIWPGPVTTNPAGNARGRAVVGATAASTARSVVVHATPTGGARIACADLA